MVIGAGFVVNMSLVTLAYHARKCVTVNVICISQQQVRNTPELFSSTIRVKTCQEN